MSSEKTLAENEATARLAAIRKTTRLLILGLTAAIVLFGLTVLWSKHLQEPKKTVAVQTPAQTVCPDASSRETLTCLMTPELSTGIKIATMADSGKRLCFVPSLPFEKSDVNGTTFWRFKTNGGQIPMKYRLFPEEMKCPGDL